MLEKLILTDEIRNDPYPENHPWSIRVKDNYGNGSITITQGGFGARPIFIGHNGNNTYLSSNFADVAGRVGTLSPSPEGRMELLMFGHVAGERTLFSQIERLPAGDKHKISAEGIYSEWTDQVADYGTTNVQTTADVFIQRLQKRTLNKPTGWLPLTGGIDSRTIASSLVDTPGIRAYTRGDSTHPEVVHAAKIARILQINHYPMPFTPHYLERNHAEILNLTGGMVSLDHSHAIHPLKDLKRLSIGIAIPGTNGEYGRVFWAMDSNNSKYPTDEQTAQSLYERQTSGKKNRYPSLLTPEAASVVETCRQRYIERYCRTAECARYQHPIAWNDEFYLRDRLRSFSVFGAVIWGSYFSLELPFLEYDYVQHVRALPPGLRTGPKLHCEIIRRSQPKLLSVPLYPSGTLLQPCFCGSLRSCIRRGLMKQKEQKQVQNYAHWLRMEKNFIEPFIQKVHQSFCGLVDDAIVKKLWKEHLAGVDHHRILWRLITPAMVDTLFT